MLAVCLAGCAAEGSSDSGKKTDGSSGAREIHLAIQPSAAFVPLVIARESGWIDEAMKEIGVTVVWTDFESGPPMNESFAAGQQDIGVIGDVPAVSAVAAGQDNVYIAAAEGGPSYGMLVADDSGINGIADLKGKKIGLTIGSTAQNLTEKLLSSVGLDYNNDVEVINISTGEAQIVLMNHDVDAVVIWEPNVSRLDALDGIHLLADGGDVGFPGMNVVFARKAYVDANPDAVKVYLTQYWRATKAYAENPDAYAEMLSGYFNLDPDLIAQAASKYAYVLQFSEDDIAGLQDTVSFLIRIGSITNEISVKDHVADGIAKEVIAANP
jgi:sulfonate transport system substrate-binding protein